MWNRELLLLLLCASVAAFAASGPRFHRSPALHAHWLAPAPIGLTPDRAGPQFVSALTHDDTWAGDAFARARDAR